MQSSSNLDQFFKFKEYSIFCCTARTLYIKKENGCLEIWNFSYPIEIFFQNWKRNFVGPHSHVISSITHSENFQYPTIPVIFGSAIGDLLPWKSGITWTSCDNNATFSSLLFSAITVKWLLSSSYMELPLEM